ncbi:uncharacterized protein LOC120930813 [Rana temporaria]|uniref:uncharacterized protein LOC120930813 n=1 Tax=Rana temporaria TaxID=8407 RepID=UPI001AAD9FBA|nr:uncharacterized protein LOC120930813 [Rana temporaria]
MGSCHLKSLHPGSGGKWVQTRVFLPATRTSFDHLSSQRSGESKSSGSPSRRIVRPKSPDSCSPVRSEQRVLFPHFCHQKAVREVSAHSEPSISKSIDQVQALQDGDSVLYQESALPKLFYGHIGSKGCLPTCPDPPSFPEIPENSGKNGNGNQALSISGPPLRSVLIPSYLHKGIGGGAGSTKVKGDNYHPLPGRPINSGRISPKITSRSPDCARLSSVPGLADKQGKIFPRSSPEGEVPGLRLLLSSPKSFSPRRKGLQDGASSVSLTDQSVGLAEGNFKDGRSHDLVFPCGTMGKVPSETIAEIPSGKLGWGRQVPRVKSLVIYQGKEKFVVVEKGSAPNKRPAMVHLDIQEDHDRCKRLGMGSPPQRSGRTGKMVLEGSKSFIEPEGTASGSQSPASLSIGDQGSQSPDSVRQHCDSGVPQQTRRHEESNSSRNSTRNVVLGRSKSRLNFSSAPEGDTKQSGRLPQSPQGGARQLVTSSRSLCGGHQQMGLSRSRFVRESGKQQDRGVLFSKPRGSISGDRCPSKSMALRPLLCLSADQTHSGSTPEVSPRRDRPYFDRPLLAQEAMVFPATVSGLGASTETSEQRGLAVAGSSVTPTGGFIKLNSLVSEEKILKAQGFSDKVIKTLVNCRKPVTRAIYSKVWKKFNSWLSENQRSTHDVPSILEFFQEGVDKGLSVSTLKVQAAAISVFLQFSLLENPTVARFFKSISRARPVVVRSCPTWDLSLVLQTLVEFPFEPLEDISVKLLTLKTIFLVAITSARRVSELQALSVREPFLTILEDRVVLKTDPGFLPKVASTFHRSQDIVLPSFCSSPQGDQEKKFSFLDVRRTLLAYLEVTKTFRKTDALFVLFSGTHKGKGASKATLARWIKQAISESYKIREVPTPFVTAHSTRALAASWAERAGASPEQICKAATWSSYSTFIKHYRLDLLSAQDQAFGRKVLQAVVPP